MLLKGLTIALYLAGEYVDVQGRYENEGLEFLVHVDWIPTLNKVSTK